VAEKVTYYRMTFSDDPPDQLGGLARRRILRDGGIVDEALHKDLQWHRSTSISGWERGEAGPELVEISEAEAERIIERFRELFGS
jgi:hypothetical protein